MKKKTIDEVFDYENKLIGADTPFHVTEAFKTLRTNVYYTASNEKCPVYGITSAFAHAGKSVIISNLALSFAQMEKKVLLIDADMRRPAIIKIFGKKESKGLSDMIIGAKNENDSFENYVIPSGYDRLDIMLSGRIPPNPSELLANVNFRKYIADMKEKYDFIFIDLPPICEVTDAGVIADFVDGYLLAVRSEVTDRRALDDALSLLDKMKARIIGFVMNGVDPKAGGYGSYKYGRKYGKYGKYYQYGYHHYANSQKEAEKAGSNK